METEGLSDMKTQRREKLTGTMETWSNLNNLGNYLSFSLMRFLFNAERLCEEKLTKIEYSKDISYNTDNKDYIVNLLPCLITILFTEIC